MTRFGSVIATHLLRDQRIAPSIGPILFIDPITFLLHLPDVAYNFVSSSPICLSPFTRHITDNAYLDLPEANNRQ